MLYFLFALVVVALDQLLKMWVTVNLASGGTISLIPGVLQLNYIENTGAAFSILSEKTWLLIVVSSVAIVLIILVLLLADMGWLGRASIAAVLGGAIGNLIDRIRLGYVVDMFEPTFIKIDALHAIFNVADVFITVGGIIFVIHYIVFSVKKEKLVRAQNAAGDDLYEEFELDGEFPSQPSAASRVQSDAIEDPAPDPNDDLREVKEFTKNIPTLSDEDISFTLEDILREAHGGDDKD